MRTTIDGGGRIVIPKAVRDELGLAAGQEIDLEFDGYTIRIERVPLPEPVLIDVDGVLVISPVDRTPVTDDDIRAVRESLQR